MSGAITLPALPMRQGTLLLADLVDLYMAHYTGRDTTRVQRLAWWTAEVGQLTLAEVSDDHVHASLERLAARQSRFFAGRDADGRPIFKARHKALSPATVNRYATALAAVFTWAVRRRIVPKGWVHPCRSVERRQEDNAGTRFLSDDERRRLLDACKASKWPRLYLLVLLALTTGARRGELLGLRWSHFDLERAVVHVARTKNGDAKVLPLVPAVIEEVQRLAGAPGGLVFASKRNPAKPFAFELRWSTALKAAGVKHFRFHDLRHSCASLLAQNGATLLEIGDLLGHRQVSMTKRYSHLAASHRSALVNRVLGDLR
jgi:integrase